MNRILYIVIVFFFGSSLCVAQENLQCGQIYPVDSIDSIISHINQREASLELLKKDKERVDTLNQLVEDYAILAQLWEDRYNNVVSSYDKYKSIIILLSESDSVFSSELPDISLVPSSLKNHYLSLSRVMNIQNDIDAIENKIEEKTKACIELNQDPLVMIPQLISDDLDALYLAISEIKESGLSTFSKEQQDYFDERIKNKYNSFEKYFTNE